MNIHSCLFSRDSELGARHNFELTRFKRDRSRCQSAKPFAVMLI